MFSPSSPPVAALYDTGADPNCISPPVFAKARAAGAVVAHLPDQSVRLDSASHHSLGAAGVYLLRVHLLGLSSVLPFVLCARLNSPLILGSQAAQQLGLRHDGATNVVSAPLRPPQAAPLGPPGFSRRGALCRRRH
jgi:hypothetical protein